ncbi:MAG: M17 family peptidase N-terminal domain-containing protein [Gemmataceae bacterium]
MKAFCRSLTLTMTLAVLIGGTARGDDPQTVKETIIAAPHNVTIKVRMEGPYTAEVPLQVVCYFRYTPELSKRMTGAPVELDKRLGGVVASLRSRGDFTGDASETLLITPPAGSIKAKALLLVGLADEGNITLEKMEGVGRTSVREASRLGVKKVAFAPLMRDQGNSKLPTGDVETAVVTGMLLAYDTETRLQKEGLAKPFVLEEWWVEAGPAYYDETIAGVRKAVQEATAAIASRPTAPYANNSK